MKTITIFTPTFNRAHLLPKLYESLYNQTCDDFIWLLIDDGSTDTTNILVKSWISENKISIKYIYQENQGMHGAHNTAYSYIDTPLNTCIDSDDYLPLNGVELIMEKWHNMDQNKYAGIVGLDAYESGVIIGDRFNTSTTTIEEFYNSGGKGDKKIVYRTDIVKKYPKYPLFKGENYVGLGTLYLMIDKDYELVTLNEVLVIVTYLETGSSNTMFKQYKKNPHGFRYNRLTTLRYSISTKRKFIECTHLISSCIFSKQFNFFENNPEKFKTLIAFIPGVIWHLFVVLKNKIN